ncbi:hypothetical protein UPYG_G00195400 [Umbra pygmaea]|uniref:KASH domain-containing protein n=1 Tax=Umbra pygmaea TaxID=75934 RepID=A0ABD0X192_UMBPY
MVSGGCGFELPVTEFPANGAIKCQEFSCVKLSCKPKSWSPPSDRPEPTLPEEMPLPVGSHGDRCPCLTRGGVNSEEDDECPVTTRPVNSLLGLDAHLEPAQPLLSNSQFLPLVEISEEPRASLPLTDCLIQDGCPPLDGCVQLERKWVLWHEFMKEYYSLNDWLQLAERLADTPRTSCMPFITAKEELRKFENLRAEAGARLGQLDGLTWMNRTLTRLFDGAMRCRLLGMARDCGQRWDRLSGTVESVCRRLKHSVFQREEFDSQRQEMAVWLSDMDLRLTEVEHSSGRDTCDKMRDLQSFQEAVGVNTGRLNSLLERGEALIQKSEPEDAQDIEAGLQDLLLYCAHVFEGVGRLHTRLLSMRLVFDDDWVLTAASDSGCPSESLLEEDRVFEKSGAPRDSSPNHDYLVLEWDPSVDIGGQVSQDDADSSYYSTNTDREKPLARDCVKRRSYLSSLGSQSDMSNVWATNPEKSEHQIQSDPEVLSPSTVRDGQHTGHWAASTLDRPSQEPVTFDPSRISAWLGQTDRHTVPSVVLGRAFSKAVQTDDNHQCGVCTEQSQRFDNILLQTQTQELRLAPCSSLSCDRHHQSDRTTCRFQPQSLEEEEPSCNASWEAKVLSDQRQGGGPNRQPQCSRWSLGACWMADTLWSPAVLVTLLAVFLALLAWPPTQIDPSCHRSNSLARSFHMALRYVNGPPPT